MFLGDVTVDRNLLDYALIMGLIIGFQFELIWALVPRMASRWPLEAHFELIWALVPRMAPRWPLEAHFELIWALVAPSGS